MFVKLVIGLVLGVSLGALIGRTQSCKTGACPLTANPWRGALWGGLLGAMFALALPVEPIASGRSESGATDGKAASAVTADATITQVADLAAFKQQVLARPGKMVVDFYATWCPPCKLYRPILEGLASENLPGVNFAKVDVDQARDVADTYGINAMPTTIIFDNGREVRRLVGLQSAEDLRRVIKFESHG